MYQKYLKGTVDSGYGHHSFKEIPEYTTKQG